MQAERRTVVPTALVLAAHDWPLAAFLAIALRRSGFSVMGLCPRRHALRHTAAVDRCFGLSRLRSSLSLLRAIRRSSPGILIPTDDESVYALYDLHARCARGGGEEASAIAHLIEHSLGDPGSFATARSKSAFLRCAGSCGVRIPATQELRDAADLTAHCAAAAPPFVLKQDGTYGGLGVIVAHSKTEAERALRRLHLRVMANALRRLFSTGNYASLLAALTARPVVSVQQYVAGRLANRAVLCWRGRVLAGLTVATLESDPFPNGPATVVEFIDEPEIDRVVETLVARLGLSGFCGFDFILERETERPFLLELNPRATSACWLGTSAHSDLCAALFRAVKDGAESDVRTAAQSQGLAGEKAALFPQEWMRSHTSLHLATSYHRVPWDDPKLVAFLARAAGAQRRRVNRGFFSRLLRRVALGKDWQQQSPRSAAAVSGGADDATAISRPAPSASTES